MKRPLLSIAILLCLSLSANARRTRVIIETDSGRIVMELYNETSKHRDNMIKLVKQKFYDSTLFHRVIPQFMVQGGDPESKTAASGAPLGDGDVGYRIPAEINEKFYHARGAIGMARDDNPEKASSGCQFYIVVGKTFTDEQLDGLEKRTGRKYTAAQRATYKSLGGSPHLDGAYTVFGEVIEGQGVAERISMAPRNQMNRPYADIRMKRVYIKKRFLFFW